MTCPSLPITNTTQLPDSGFPLVPEGYKVAEPTNGDLRRH